MKRILLLFLLTFYMNFSFGQVPNLSEFKKFSYLIFSLYDIQDSLGFVKFKSTHGTCFFTKIEDKIFLVSAKHTLLPFTKGDDKNHLDFPDTLKVRLEDMSGNVVFHNIDIRIIKDTISNFLLLLEPDIFMIEFKDAVKYKINIIDDYLRQSDEKIDNIVTFGYPAIPITPETFSKFINQAPELTTGKVLSKSEVPLLSEEDKNDNSTYLIARNDTLNKEGCSGSPVFYKSLMDNQWRFGGVFVKSGPDNIYSQIVKPKYLFQIRKNHLH